MTVPSRDLEQGRRPRAVRLIHPDFLSLALTAVIAALAVVMFGWPFVIDSESALRYGNDIPWLFPLLVALLGATVLAGLTGGGLDAKRTATVGTLVSLGAALRVAATGIAGIEPMFFVVVLAGRALGPVGGLLVGSGSVLTGAFITAGVGPWLPYQMMAAGAVGWGAGCVPHRWPRGERWILAAYGFAASLLFGVVMNLWFWPFLGDGAPVGASFVPGAGLLDQLQHYGRFYVVTSLGWDVMRGLTNVALLLTVGPALLRVLRRAVRRAAFDVPARFDPADARPETTRR